MARGRVEFMVKLFCGESDDRSDVMPYNAEVRAAFVAKYEGK